MQFKMTTCKITPQMAQEARQFDSAESFLRAGGLDISTLDNAAFGFTSDDIIEIWPSNIRIKWRDDLINVLYEIKHSGLPKKKWAEQISLETPVEISYEKSRFYLEDGHHRYTAAKILGKPLTAKIQVKDRPLDVLGKGMKYDDFIRCVWDKANELKETIMMQNKIVLTEQQILLLEDRKQFDAYIEKRKNQSKKVTDQDISNIESLSGSDGYLVLLAKLYFNEIDRGTSPDSVKNILKSVVNTIQQHPNVSKLLPKQLFQYNDYWELREDLRDSLTLISAKTFYKKLPAKLKDEAEFKNQYKKIANLYLQIKEKNIERVILKKSANFNSLDSFIDFIENVLDSAEDYEEIKSQFSNRHVKLVYENPETQVLLFAAIDEYGVDLLTENTVWCIRDGYDGYMGYRNQYSYDGTSTFCKLYDLLSEFSDYKYFGFFTYDGNMYNCYDAGDDEAIPECKEVLTQNNIDLNNIPEYTYYFYDEEEDPEEDPEEETPEEESFDFNSNKMSFLQLAYLMQSKYKVHFFRYASFSRFIETDITHGGKQFIALLKSSIKYDENYICSDSDFQENEDDYMKIFTGYFRGQTISTKQVINFFERYYDGFTFNYHHSGADLFGGVSTTIDKEPINNFMNQLMQLGLPINLNESKIRVIVSDSILVETKKQINTEKK